MNVALIGSGSWGTAVAGLAAARAEHVTMWAHSEQTAAGINGEHRNPRYLVDYELPSNVVATTDLTQTLDGAEASSLPCPPRTCAAYAIRQHPSSPPTPRYSASPRVLSPIPACS